MLTIYCSVNFASKPWFIYAKKINYLVWIVFTDGAILYFQALRLYKDNVHI